MAHREGFEPSFYLDGIEPSHRVARTSRGTNPRWIRGNRRGAHSPQPFNHEVLLSYNTP